MKGKPITKKKTGTCPRYLNKKLPFFSKDCTNDILLKEKNNLKFLGKSDGNVDTISTVITELKKNGVGVDALGDPKLFHTHPSAAINQPPLKNK